MKHYRVFMSTVSGMFAQYSGHVDIWSDGDDLFSDAVRQLRRTAYPDYTASMWRMERYEVLQ